MRVSRLKAVVVATALLVAAAVGPPPIDAADPPVPPSNRYGVNDDYVTPLLPETFTKVRESGAGWVLYTLYWNVVNPEPGVFDWTYPDTEIQRILDAGLNVYLRIRYPPSWATGTPWIPNDQVPFWCSVEVYGEAHMFDSACDPSHPNFRFHIPDAGAFTTFVDAAVRRYKDRVRTFGFGEEAHNRALWRGTLDQFVSIILRPGYVTAKAIDPNLTIVGPDEDWAHSLEALLQLEGTYGRWCDVISFHLLRMSGASVHLLDDANATDSQKAIFGLKAVYDRVGQGRPVWLTELGSNSEAGTENDPGPRAQGQWLRGQLDQVWLRPWIDKVFIYRLKHVNGGIDSAILNADDTPKPAFTRFSEFMAEQQPPRTSYLAEGASNPFTHDVSLANPAARPAPVKITFLRDGGTPIVVPQLLPPQSRTTIRASDVPGALGALSTVVESTSGAPVVVERTMFSANWKWGHTGNAVESAATAWFFGEGSQGFFDTFVLLANAGVGTANVRVRFLVEGAEPFVVDRQVAGNTRVTIYTGDYETLRDKNFAVAVDSDQPIIAERAMYFPGFSNFAWAAGHESAGVPALATEWFHAEGSTGPYFDMFLLLGNPNDSPVHTTVTYYRPAPAEPVEIPYYLEPNSRRTINVELEDARLADSAVSARVTATLPIVSERAMYWPGSGGQWWEAHNSVGLTTTATKWGLAEGRVGGAFGFETYVLVANPAAQGAQLRVTFLRGGGLPPIVKEGPDWVVGAGGRFTIGVTPTWNMADIYDGEFGVVVESLNGVPVVVERAMYWNLPGLRWAGGTNAAGTPIP